MSEAQIDDLEHQLSAVIETVADGIITIDAKGAIRTFNPAAERLFGYTALEIIGQNVRILTPEPHRSNHDQYLLNYLTTGVRKIIGTDGRQVEGVRKDGSRFPLKLSLSEMLVGGERMFTGVIRDLTETELILARYRGQAAAIDASQAMIEFAMDGTILHANRNFLVLFGYSEDELVGRHRRILSDPESAATEEFRQFWQQLQLGEVQTGEFPRRTKDGSTLWLQATYTPVLGLDGKPDRVIKFAKDISGRLRAAAQTNAALDKLKTLETALAEHSMVSMTDVTGKITFVNDKFCAVSEYSADELLGQDHRIINSGHHSAEFIRDMWNTIARGNVWKGEFRNRTKGGTFYWSDTTVVPSLGPNGKPIGYVAIRTDITARKASDEALKAAALIDRIGARVMVALNQQDQESDPGVEVLRVLADEAGYRPIALYAYDEWEGGLALSAGLGLAPGAQKKFRLGEGLVGEAATLREPTFMNSAVDSLFSLDTGVGLVGAATVFALPLVHRGKLLGVIAGASHARLLERERSWLSQLAGQVAVGLYSLQQYQELKELSLELNARSHEIEAQNTELARASRLKSEFLASMSHELRTPLNAIIGFSEVLKDGLLGDLEEEQLDYVGEIFRSGRHLLSLINDILDLSKIEAGKMELDVETIDLESLATNALTIVKDRAFSGGVIVNHSIEPGLVYLEADGRKVRQIIYNLLSNAVKFTPKGGTVKLDIFEHDNGVEFAVIDTGIGISKADQARLFRPFEQLDGGIDRKYEGTGLGLSMVKSLVELHGGTLGVESTEGQGSRFWVRIPHSRLGAYTSLQEISLGEAESSTSSSDPRVLVVDDDPAALDLARRWLSKEGYTVEGAMDCGQAWAMLAERHYDAILLDIIFAQGDDGWTCLADLKRTPEFALIPVVIVSIVAELGRGLALGAEDVLQKPIAGADLILAIDGLGLRPEKLGEAIRVLVVDDDARAVEHVSRRLEQAGLAVTRAYGGAEALDAIAAGRFSAVVLDLMMPHVSGFDVLRELRANPATSDLPVIILTAKALEPSERAVLKKSVVEILMKEDWDERTFLQLIRASIHRRKRRTLAQAKLDIEPPPPAPIRRVLVIDDDPNARELMRLYLEDAGFTVLAVDGAEDGVSKIKHFRPDLITLDLTLPGMDGLSFLTQHADSDLLRGVPVLVVSSAEGLEKALAVGAQAILPKPIRRHEFLEVIQNLVHATSQHRPYVMVVDDDPKAVKIVSSYFSDEPVEVVCAHGGQEAIDSIQVRRPDIVILDLMMPEVSGYQVLTALRANPATASIPVVILSAKDLTARDRSAFAENVQATLAKATVGRGELLERVWEILDTTAANHETGGRL